MATTVAALAAGSRLSKFCWVIAIEGYDTLLTSRSDLTSEVLTAWAGTPWATSAKCIGGAQPEIALSQDLDPWRVQPTPNEIKIVVSPNGSPGGPFDEFGTLVHAPNAGNEAYQSTAMDANDLALTVEDTGQLSLPCALYAGVERLYATAGVVGTTITLSSRGDYSPFNRGSETDHEMGRDHAIPTLEHDTYLMPIVTDAPRDWVGKYVGCWLHTVEAGSLNTKANAQLVFAGTIEAIDDDEFGNTIVSCVHVVDKINRTTLHRDQFTCHLAKGIPVYGDSNRFSVTEAYVDSGGDTTNTGSDLIPTDPVVDAYDILPGTYTAEELCDTITQWLKQAGPDNDADIDGTYELACEDGRCVFTADWPGDVASVLRIDGPRAILTALGFNVDGGDTDRGSVSFSDVGGGDTIMAPNGVAYTGAMLTAGTTIDIEATSGTLINRRDWFPPSLYDRTASGECWALLEVGDRWFFAKADSATTPTQFSDVTFSPMWDEQIWDGGVEPIYGDVEVKEIAILSGRMATVVSALFASTGVTSYNGGYDMLPTGLGAAIPWEILGNDFINSLYALEETAGDDYTIVISKPTPLWDVIGADMLLRMGYLIWRDEHLRWTTIQVPSAVTAQHTLSETTKASSQQGDRQRAIIRTDSGLMRNVLKIRHAKRYANGDYTSTTQIRHAGSIANHGESAAQTIEARNSYTMLPWIEDPVPDLAIAMASKLMPIFGVPLTRMRVTVSPAYYEQMSPGDIVTISDSHARDPDTGERGISAKPGMVLAHRINFGGGKIKPMGEIDLVIFAKDRTSRYSPSGYTSSWSGTDITLSAHEYSESSEDADATHWDDGDAVWLVEIDPDNPAAADSLESTVNGTPAGNVVTLADSAAGLTGSYYRLVSDTYDDADIQTTQQADVYLADADDMRIADAASPYQYGEALTTLGTTAADPTDLCERHAADYFGDGTSCPVGVTVAMARNVNNLIGYTLAPHGSWLFESPYAITMQSYLYLCHIPYYVGAPWPAGYTRKLTIAPQFCAGTSDTAYVRVTLSLSPPKGTTTTGTYWDGDYTQLTPWSTSSTTYVVGTAATASALANNYGRGYLTVEVKNTNASASGGIWGLPKLWLGPLEAI